MSDGFLLKASKRNETSTKPATQTNDNVLNADDGYVKTRWRQDQIWIEAVDKEQRSTKEWNEKWSFLAEYDQKGNLKMKEKLPDKISMFSETLPNSFGHLYGNRLGTEEAKQIKTLEQAMAVSYRKRRSKDLACYD